MSLTFLIILIAALGAVVVVLYNRLVRSRNRVRTAWSDIDVQLQRRHDLIPKLVKAVDAYAKYERATLEAVTELRTEAMRVVDREHEVQVVDRLRHALHESAPQQAAEEQAEGRPDDADDRNDADHDRHRRGVWHRHGWQQDLHLHRSRPAVADGLCRERPGDRRPVRRHRRRSRIRARHGGSHLPDDTRLWAALQRVSGGTWGGCIYHVEKIIQTLEAGRQALAGAPREDAG